MSMKYFSAIFPDFYAFWYLVLTFLKKYDIGHRKILKTCNHFQIYFVVYSREKIFSKIFVTFLIFQYL